MAIITKRTAPTSATDAAFRSWGSTFKSLIEVGGFWQQASDTGQIDWNTVARPTGNSEVKGYEIYKTVDTLSSEFTLYMKIEYMGSTTASQNMANFRVQFATKTDGAGGLLGGNIGSQVRHAPDNNGASTTEFSSDASGGPGYWGVLGWRDFPDNFNPAINSFCMCVGRSVDSFGEFTSDYITIFLSFTNSNSNGPQFQQTIWNPTIKKIERSFGYGFTVSIENSTGSASDGTDAIAMPIFPFIGFLDNPMLNLVGLKSVDVKNGGVADIDYFGTTRKFLFGGARWSAGAFHTPKIYDLGAVDQYIRPGILWL